MLSRAVEDWKRRINERIEHPWLFLCSDFPLKGAAYRIEDTKEEDTAEETEEEEHRNEDIFDNIRERKLSRSANANVLCFGKRQSISVERKV